MASSLRGRSSSGLPAVTRQTGEDWCGRRDLNPHDLRHWNLNPARAPVCHNFFSFFQWLIQKMFGLDLGHVVDTLDAGQTPSKGPNSWQRIRCLMAVCKYIAARPMALGRPPPASAAKGSPKVPARKPWTGPRTRPKNDIWISAASSGPGRLCPVCPRKKTFGAAAQSYRREVRGLAATTRSASHVKLLELRMRAHVLPHFKDKPLSAFNKEMVQSYRVKRG